MTLHRGANPRSYVDFGSAAFNSEVQHMSSKLHWVFGN
jgi:hypothetical protein